MRVLQLGSDDHGWWLASRRVLFDDEDAGLLGEEERQIIAGEFRGLPCVVRVAWDGAERVGFAEVGLRTGAEGCLTSPVCYLEGWWVVESHRGRGVGRALVEAAAVWGRGHGCTEMASDALIDNTASESAHRGLGFDVVERITCVRRSIG